MYSIKDYDKRYMPRDKSRHPLVHTDYVKLPANPRGDGLQTLLKYRRGLEVFGVWCLLLEKTTLAKPENRGKLLNHKEEPATVAEIAMGISLERQVKLVEYALSVLVQMGWVECVGDAGKCGESAPLSVVECSVVECSGVKGKRKYLDFVFLTPKEHEKLVKRFGQSRTISLIEDLNNGIGSKGYRYTSHYHTILSWVRKDEKETAERKPVPKLCTGRVRGARCKKPATFLAPPDNAGQERWYCEKCKPKYKPLKDVPQPQMRTVPGKAVNDRNQQKDKLGVR